MESQEGEAMIREYELRTIDAWHYDGGWNWNDSSVLERGVWLSDDSITPRKLFKFMRRNDWLSRRYSKGRIQLHDDGNVLEIQRRTGEPLLAFMPTGKEKGEE